MEEKKIRKVFLDELPKYKTKNINWESSEGRIVKFIYEDITGIIEIVKYINKNDIIIKYNNEETIIKIVSLKNCNLGKLLNIRTNEFKIKKGTTYKDKKRDITITDMEIRTKVNKYGKEQDWKYYKYHCNICGWTEGWICEGDITRGNGCSCCSGNTVVQGINDIPTIAPFMISYFQGGYDEAKLYTKWGSGNPNNKEGYIYPICPDCLRVRGKKLGIWNIYKNHSITCSCSDSIPYPEKIMFSGLNQLELDFQTQLSKTTFKWCKNYKYDFYFEYNNENFVIEVNGEQHYKQTNRKNARSYEEEVENDKIKKELALTNGVKEENYIVIDCRKSELEFIKQNILSSRLNELFDLSKINWLKTEEFALSTRIKEACEYKRNSPDLTCSDIGIIMKLSDTTVRTYLKKGSKIWDWINYDANKEKRNSGSRSGKSSSKQVEIFKDGISLGMFESATELARRSEELFGVKLLFGNISAVCLGNRKQHKGYIFKYVS